MRRSMLFAAAIALFLATAVGMSKSGVFAHFGSNEQLQLALLDSVRARFVVFNTNPALRQPPGQPPQRRLLVRDELLLPVAVRRRHVVRLQPRQVRQRPGRAPLADLGPAQHPAGVPPGEVGRLQDQGFRLARAGDPGPTRRKELPLS